MRKIVLLICFFCFLFSQGFAQESLDFKIVDSLSKDYYQNGDWKALSLLGKKATAQGIDYYRLNIRTGYAFYERGHYYNAEKYYLSALKQNNTSAEVRTYLNWTYLNMGDEFRANDILDSASNKFRFSPNIYVELGEKLSGNTNFSSMSYRSIDIGQKITKRFRLNLGYTYLNQDKTPWGNITQHQILLKPSFYFGKGWELRTHFQVAYFAGNINYPYSSSYANQASGFLPGGMTALYDTLKITSHQWTGNVTQNVMMSSLALQKTFGRWKITPLMSIISENFSPNYTDKTEITGYTRIWQGTRLIRERPIYSLSNVTINSAKTNIHFQGGLSLYYTPNILADALGLGFKGYYYASSSTREFLPMPYLNYKITSLWYLHVDYLQKGYYPIADESLLLNNYNAIAYRFSMTNQFVFPQIGSFFLTNQVEKQTDYFSKQDVQFFSFFLGFKFHL